MKPNKENSIKDTQKLPPSDNRSNELRVYERKNQEILRQHRRELKKAIEELSILGEKIPDTKTQLHILQHILPTFRAVENNVIPDSMQAEIEKLHKIADKVAIFLPDVEAAATVAQIKRMLNDILATIPSE